MNQQPAQPTTYTTDELIAIATRAEHTLAQNYSADLFLVAVTSAPLAAWPSLVSSGLQALLHEHPQPSALLAQLICALADLCAQYQSPVTH